jgi:CheY-like chemotaxis protein
MAEILGGAHHLLQLINQVLDLAAVENGRMAVALTAVPLTPLLADCLGLLQPLAVSSGVAMTLGDAPPEGAALVADPTRLKQVLLNLLGNAIKYNRRGGEVRIDCQPAADGLRITVVDNGPGLTVQQQARLFDPFERLDASGEVEGSGLGLALSRSLVTAMQGRIGVDSQPDTGSRFWIELPLVASTTAARDEPRKVTLNGPELPTRARSLKVLYIEDNPVNLMLIEAMLAELPGLLVQSRVSPVEGLACALADPPDLVLLDIQMPDLDGYQVLAALRADSATCRVPVIAASADAMPQSVARGHAAGFAHYLTKPLELASLLAAVQSALADHPPPR